MLPLPRDATLAPRLACVGERSLQCALLACRRSTTRLCSPKSERAQHGPAQRKQPQFSLNVSMINPAIKRLNDRTEHHLCKVPGVRLLDGYAWTRDRCHSYDDAQHHSLLTFSHVVTVLRHECGIVSA